MSQLDGTRISKPTAPSLTPSRPQKTHRCCGRLFASPPSREKARDDFYGDEEISEDDAPMRIVSPRVTDTVPVAPAPKTKKKSVSLKSTSKSTDEASMVTACEGEKVSERE